MRGKQFLFLFALVVLFTVQSVKDLSLIDERKIFEKGKDAWMFRSYQPVRHDYRIIFVGAT
jgi:hypothetical protein